MLGSLEIGGNMQLRNELLALVSVAPHSYATAYTKQLNQPYGLPVTFHYFHRSAKNHHHKLQFIDMPNLRLPDLVNTLQHLVDDEFSSLKTYRIDFTVDVPDVPMWWCRKAIGYTHKKTKKEWSSEQGIEGIRLGAKNNNITVYDKVAERLQKYPYACEDGVPTFEEYSGFSQSDVVTRIERQISKHVPDCLATFGDVVQNAADFNPFGHLTIQPPPDEWPQIDAMKYRDYAKLVFWRSEVDNYGYHEAYKRAQMHSGKNAARFLGPALKQSPNKKVPALTVEWLLERCTATTHEQICAYLKKGCAHD